MVSCEFCKKFQSSYSIEHAKLIAIVEIEADFIAICEIMYHVYVMVYCTETAIVSNPWKSWAKYSDFKKQSWKLLNANSNSDKRTTTVLLLDIISKMSLNLREKIIYVNIDLFHTSDPCDRSWRLISRAIYSFFTFSCGKSWYGVTWHLKKPGKFLLHMFRIVVQKRALLSKFGKFWKFSKILSFTKLLSVSLT